MPDTILSSHQYGVITLTLNRPNVLNTLDPAMAAALEDATRTVAEDDRVRCVVIRGAGGNFMAGGDIGYFHQCLSLPPNERAAKVGEIITIIHAAIRTLREMPKPVVAAVEGACAGFGVSLMSACDLAVATESAVFSLAYSRLGVSPDGGSTHALPRTVGAKNAMALALLAERFHAEEAFRMGLINQVVKDDALEDAVTELCKRLVAGPQEALARTKALINRSLQSTLEQQLAAEEASFIASVEGDEFEEGVRAFVEKRKPDFNK